MDSATDTEVHFDPSKKPADDAVTLRLNRTESSRSQRRRSSEASKNRKTGCCPKLFERASGSWWNPKFNSPIIEQQFLKNCFSQVRRRFQTSLVYFILVTVLWIIYIPLHPIFDPALKECQWIHYEIALGCLLAFCVLLLALTATKYYEKCVIFLSFVLAFILCSLLVMFTVFSMNDPLGAQCNGQVMSNIATFALAVETILMTYTVMPISFLLTALFMIVFSVVYEVLYFYSVKDYTDMLAGKIITKLLLHICVHVMGTHIFFMSQVRTRSTFMKIGEAIVARRQHKKEKQVKELTIHALMPTTIAKELLSRSETEGGRKQTIFRPFYMNRMEDVSILFADIAGFTQMSANKSAETLVGLLNDLFGRFDILCVKNKCEKICTLGDCYYCVSGCPLSRTDHAVCCVKMGLTMIDAIKDFCKAKGEKVNMRVGVHTGTVLCGIIGNRRFKFDVWSNDVTIANKMEASGEPGKVHVSAETAKFLGDQFLLEESPAEKRPLLLGMKTYFIVSKNESSKTTNNHSGTPTSVHKVGISVNSTDNQDSESANSDPVATARDGIANQTSKPLLSDEIKVPSEHNTPQESSLLTTSHQADSSAEEASKRPENGGVGSVRGSIDDSGQEEPTDASSTARSPVALADTLFWKESKPGTDRQFVDCIIDEGRRDYFQKPPVNNCTLEFLNSDIERSYREQFTPEWLQGNNWKEDDSNRRNRRHSSDTISTSRYNTVFDVAIACTVYIMIAISCFLVFHSSIPWYIIFPIAFLIEFYILVAVSREAFCRKLTLPLTEAVAGFFHIWGMRHVLGLILISLPVIAVYSNYNCNNDLKTNHFYCFILVVALLHFCNFVQLSSWLKTVVAVVCAIIFLVVLYIDPCNVSVTQDILSNNTEGITSPSTLSPETLYIDQALVTHEVVLDILLLLVLIFLLNREFEINFRLNFYGGVEAANDREKMQCEKEEAEDLVHHIIPHFVTKQLRTTQEFSQNHQSVAVIFCSIVNFNDFYEEAYQGGKECIRVLHELISDFDNLLMETRFGEVEKIKTIGSTYMVACGLHPPSKEGLTPENQQLKTLMEFSLEMMGKIHQFNDDVLSMTKGAFNFILRIGYNHGQLTSGVIGTTKLLYDIWGDTVNVASRMDSTGVPGRIQVTEHSMMALEPYYEFEYRGPVEVRGKGVMTTYLVVKRKESPALK